MLRHKCEAKSWRTLGAFFLVYYLAGLPSPLWSDVVVTTQELENLLTSCETLEKKLTGLEARLQAAQSKQAELQQSLEQRENLLKSILAESLSLREESESLRRQIAQSEARATELAEKSAQESARAKELSTRLETLQPRFDAFIAATESKIKALETERIIWGIVGLLAGAGIGYAVGSLTGK